VRREGVLILIEHRAHLGARRRFKILLRDEGNDLMTLIPPRGDTLRQEARDKKGGEDRWPGRKHRNETTCLLETVRQPS
jgi:hypothetical protein